MKPPAPNFFKLGFVFVHLRAYKAMGYEQKLK
jgi:hypothetical protein